MFFLFSEYIHLSVLQAILVHRSLHVLHVLLEHVCGVEKKFDVRYLLSTISFCGFFFLVLLFSPLSCCLIFVRLTQSIGCNSFSFCFMIPYYMKLLLSSRNRFLSSPSTRYSLYSILMNFDLIFSSALYQGQYHR